MNILDLLGSDTIKNYAEKFGLDQEQLTNIVSSALPLFKDGASLDSIGEKVSETTGISLETINPILSQFAPKVKEILGGNMEGIMDTFSGFFGNDDKEKGGLSHLLGGFLK